jgi:hypothetical protein
LYGRLEPAEFHSRRDAAIQADRSYFNFTVNIIVPYN